MLFRSQGKSRRFDDLLWLLNELGGDWCAFSTSNDGPCRPPIRGLSSSDYRRCCHLYNNWNSNRTSQSLDLPNCEYHLWFCLGFVSHRYQRPSVTSAERFRNSNNPDASWLVERWRNCYRIHRTSRFVDFVAGMAYLSINHHRLLTKDALDSYFAASTPDRKSTRLNSSHSQQSRMPSSA